MTTEEHTDDKIPCAICGERTHVMKRHLLDAHPGVTEAEYQDRFPGAPMLSETAQNRLREIQEAKESKSASDSTVHEAGDFTVTLDSMAKVFKLGRSKAANSTATGNPIMVSKFVAPEHLRSYIPDVDENYVFNIDLLKTALMAFENRLECYFWGMSGTGKTTIFEQVCANTGRPYIRVQHTRNTEEDQIVGQYVVRNGQTEFELGPLPFAMKYGLTYCADEYDFGMPSVLALYQPVLEGKALVIKNAPPELRIIKPHPLFRFCATGNTNGTGDETGLYQGTLIQNAANYERFDVVEEVHYMDKKIEVEVVAAQAKITKEDAEKIVEFGGMAREAYKQGKLSLPPSPRALINAAVVGNLRADYAAGMRLAYINRLSRVDQEAANQVMQRLNLAKVGH